MRFVVFGAGAIGGVLGARLTQADYDVVLVARGAHYEAIRTHGLRLEAPEGTTTLRLPVAADAGELRLSDGDVVLLATKSQDTDGALTTLLDAAAQETPIVCVQNSVANERAASRFFANVYGVCVMCPAEHLEPGVVVAQAAPITGILDVGRYPAGADDLARELAAAFASARFESAVREDVMRWKYAKLVLNLGNVVDALCERGTGGRDLTTLLRAEGEAVLQAAGIDFASAEEDAARRGDLLQLHDVAGRPRVGSSTLQSLARGTGSIETDYLNGEIVLLGRLHGIPTPANTLLQATARHFAADGSAPGSLSASALQARLS